MRPQKTPLRFFLKNARPLLEEVPESSNSALSSHKKHFLNLFGGCLGAVWGLFGGCLGAV